MVMQDKMIYLEGSRTAFRCDCGSNVFHSPDDEPERFICNWCGTGWRGEPVAGAVVECSWCAKVVPVEAIAMVETDRVCRPCVGEFLEARIQ